MCIRSSLMVLCTATLVLTTMSPSAAQDGEDLDLEFAVAGVRPVPGTVDVRDLNRQFDGMVAALLPSNWRVQLISGPTGMSGAVVVPLNTNTFHAPDCAAITEDTEGYLLPGPTAALIDGFKPCSRCQADICQTLGNINFYHNLRLANNNVRVAYQGCLRSLSRATRYGIGAGIEQQRMEQYQAAADEDLHRGMWYHRHGLGHTDRRRSDALFDSAAAGYGQAAKHGHSAVELQLKAGQGYDEFERCFNNWRQVSQYEHMRLRDLILRNARDPI
jgi:hypothetical protein